MQLSQIITCDPKIEFELNLGLFWREMVLLLNFRRLSSHLDNSHLLLLIVLYLMKAIN